MIILKNEYADFLICMMNGRCDDITLEDFRKSTGSMSNAKDFNKEDLESFLVKVVRKIS